MCICILFNAQSQFFNMLFLTLFYIHIINRNSLLMKSNSDVSGFIPTKRPGTNPGPSISTWCYSMAEAEDVSAGLSP